MLLKGTVVQLKHLVQDQPHQFYVLVIGASDIVAFEQAVNYHLLEGHLAEPVLNDVLGHHLLAQEHVLVLVHYGFAKYSYGHWDARDSLAYLVDDRVHQVTQVVDHGDR